MGRPKGTRNSITLSIKDKINLVEQCIEKVNNNAGSEDDNQASNWKNKVNITTFATERSILPRVLKKWISQYKTGQLKLVMNSENRIRIKKCSFQIVEDKLIQYMNLRLSNFHKGKCGLSWNKLREEGKLIAEKFLTEEEAKTFQASVGWLRGVLERNGFSGISLPGEPCYQCDPLVNEAIVSDIIETELQQHNEDKSATGDDDDVDDKDNEIGNESSDCKNDIDENALSLKEATNETVSPIERSNEICSSQKKRKGGVAFDEDGSFGNNVCELQHKAIRTSLFHCKKQTSMFDFVVSSATTPAIKTINEDISPETLAVSHSLNNQSFGS